MNVCPLCKNEYEGYPAVSRKDNKTEICNDCGVVEALSDYMVLEKQKRMNDIAKIYEFFNRVDERWA
jgi:hypothetical protein|tara:strand:- start:1285 stop:1485 length:201 start_codon:yes stop_codon:yes gene_type:complete